MLLDGQQCGDHYGYSVVQILLARVIQVSFSMTMTMTLFTNKLFYSVEKYTDLYSYIQNACTECGTYYTVNVLSLAHSNFSAYKQNYKI